MCTFHLRMLGHGVMHILFFVDLVIFPFFPFSIIGPNHSKQTSYIILQKTDLLSNGTLKISYKDKYIYIYIYIYTYRSIGHIHSNGSPSENQSL